MTRPVFCRYVSVSRKLFQPACVFPVEYLKTIGQSGDKWLPQKTQTLQKQITATTRQTETTDSFWLTWLCYDHCRQTSQQNEWMCPYWTSTETDTTATQQRTETRWTGRKLGVEHLFLSLRHEWNSCTVIWTKTLSYTETGIPTEAIVLRRHCLGNENYLSWLRITSEVEFLPLYNQRHFMTATWLKTNNMPWNDWKTTRNGI